MGMTQEEYWDGPPELTKAYREYHRLKTESRNYEMWWQGFYVYEAIITVAHNLVPKSKPIGYPDKPHRITPLTEEEQQAKIEEARRDLIAYLDSKAEAWSRNNG